MSDDTNNQQKLAEEREKRRERLLAGRDARLSKIVSSVGGTNFTPPLSDLPSSLKPEAVKPQPQQSRKKSKEEPVVRARHVAKEASASPVAPPSPPPSTPTAQEQPEAAGPSMLDSDNRQTILLLVINLGLIVSGWYYLGRDCFKQVFANEKLSFDCSVLFVHARKVYLGVFVAALVPIILAHVRSGNLLMIPSSLVSIICLWMAVLVMIGMFVERL